VERFELLATTEKNAKKDYPAFPFSLLFQFLHELNDIYQPVYRKERHMRLTAAIVYSPKKLNYFY
jgi:hypothetical protein